MSYVREWHTRLKETAEFDFSLKKVDEKSDQTKYDASSATDQEDNDAESKEVAGVKHQNEHLTDTDTDDLKRFEMKQKSRKNYSPQELYAHQQLNNRRLIQKMNILLCSMCTFALFNCFILGFLLDYLLTNEKMSGLLFLQSSLVVLTCFLFYYPSYLLTKNGYIILRILRSIYLIICIGLFLFLLRSHIQACSSIALCTTIGVKFFREIPFLFKKTFTFNELCLLCSLAACGTFVFFMHIYKIIQTEHHEVTVVEHSIIWLLLLASLTKRLTFAKSTFFGFIFLALMVLASYFVPMCYFLLGQNPFIWLYSFLTNQNAEIRIQLLMTWIILFNTSFYVWALKQYFFDSKNKNPSKNLTITRKSFHLLIVIVYITGLKFDKHFLYLCSFGMLILLLLVEIIRYHKIGKASQLIQQGMNVFLDEKDASSELILSHIYLLVGLSYPIWISDLNVFHVADLSGVITVGIGDSFASLIGSKYGRRMFLCSKKSLEGSLAMAISQVITFCILGLLQFINLIDINNITFVCTCIVLSTFLEAFTNDNDNLALPILIFPFLRLIS